MSRQSLRTTPKTVNVIDQLTGNVVTVTAIPGQLTSSLSFTDHTDQPVTQFEVINADGQKIANLLASLQRALRPLRSAPKLR